MVYSDEEIFLRKSDEMIFLTKSLNVFIPLICLLEM